MGKRKEVILGKSQLKKSKAGFWSCCKRYGQEKGLSEEDAEDFAQQCLIVKERGWKQSIHQMFCDYIRDKTNWSRSLKARRADFIEFDDKALLTIKEFKEGKSDDYSYIDFEKIVKEIKNPKRRAIMRLRYKWGFTLMEIASLFDVTESRMSQIITTTLQKLKKELAIFPISKAGEA